MSAFEDIILGIPAFVKKEFIKIIGVLSIIVIIVGAILISASEKKHAQPAPAVVEQIAEPTPDIMLDAMLRAWAGPRFLKVCYDAPTNNSKYGFFVLYGPKTDPEDKSLDAGWWYVEQQFFRTSAGSVYTNDIAGLSDDRHVYPDVTGLACKDKQ